MRLTGEAEASKTQAIGLAEAKATEALGLARAAGFQAQTEALGQTATALVAVANAVADGHITVVPEVLVTGGGGAIEGLAPRSCGRSAPAATDNGRGHGHKRRSCPGRAPTVDMPVPVDPSPVERHRPRATFADVGRGAAAEALPLLAQPLGQTLQTRATSVRMSQPAATQRPLHDRRRSTAASAVVRRRGGGSRLVVVVVGRARSSLSSVATVVVVVTGGFDNDRRLRGRRWSSVTVVVVVGFTVVVVDVTAVAVVPRDGRGSRRSGDGTPNVHDLLAVMTTRDAPGRGYARHMGRRDRRRVRVAATRSPRREVVGSAASAATAAPDDAIIRR